MGGLERRRAKRVAREVEVWRYGRRWVELASVVWAWAKGLAEEAWEQFGERDRQEGVVPDSNKRKQATCHSRLKHGHPSS